MNARKPKTKLVANVPKCSKTSLAFIKHTDYSNTKLGNFRVVTDYIKDLISEDLERNKNSEKLQLKKEIEDIKIQINLVENSLQEIKELALELKRIVLG